MINKLNADQANLHIRKLHIRIHIRRLEKVQHIDSAQRSQTDGPSHRWTCRYTLLKHGGLILYKTDLQLAP